MSNDRIAQAAPSPAPDYVTLGHCEERCLTLAEVCGIVSRKKTWVYERMAIGEFPPADEGRWYYSEVMAYLARRRESRGVAGSVVGSSAKNAANN